MVRAAQAANENVAAWALRITKEASMSMRQECVRRGLNRSCSAGAVQGVIHSIFEKMEERRLLSGGIQLVGITGNQQNADYLDETLYDIKYGASGTSDPTFLDGFEDITSNPPDTQLSISTTSGVTEGQGALRVDVDNGVGAFWGIRSPNVVDMLKTGATTLSYDLTLTNQELNGGSYGGGTDNSFHWDWANN